jgi:peptidoglycan/LPS O-acetylase OafA/YrhL
VAENLVQYGLGLRSTNGMGASAVALDLLVLAGIIVVSKSTYRWIERPFRDGVKARLAPAPPAS